MSWLSRNLAKLGAIDAFTDSTVQAAIQAEVREELNTAFPATLDCDTPNCALAWEGGRTTYNSVTHTCTTDEDNKTHNLFTVTGAVRVLAIWCYITEAAATADFENFKLQLDDGANQIDLCAVSNLDSITVGSLLERDEDSDALVELDGAQVRYNEVASNQKVFTEGTILQKYDTTTYIRSIFDGSDVDCDMFWVIRWAPMTSTSTVATV